MYVIVASHIYTEPSTQHFMVSNPGNSKWKVDSCCSQHAEPSSSLHRSGFNLQNVRECTWCRGDCKDRFEWPRHANLTRCVRWLLPKSMEWKVCGAVESLASPIFLRWHDHVGHRRVDEMQRSIVDERYPILFLDPAVSTCCKGGEITIVGTKPRCPVTRFRNQEPLDVNGSSLPRKKHVNIWGYGGDLAQLTLALQRFIRELCMLRPSTHVGFQLEPIWIKILAVCQFWITNHRKRLHKMVT